MVYYLFCFTNLYIMLAYAYSLFRMLYPVRWQLYIFVINLNKIDYTSVFQRYVLKVTFSKDSFG